MTGTPAALRAQLGEAAQLSFAEASPSLERRGQTSWTFGDLPETLSIVKHGQRLTGYPEEASRLLWQQHTFPALPLIDR